MIPDLEQQSSEEPWEVLENLIQVGDGQRLEAYLNTLTPAETARAISRLNQSDQTRLLTLLTPAEAADLIEDLSPEQAAAILDEMPSDQQADLLGELHAEDAEAILQEMAPQEAQNVRQLLSYPADTAGGIMITEYLSYPDHWRVA